MGKKMNLIIFMLVFVCISGFSAMAVTGDLDGDGSINSIDFSYMRRFILGDIKEFPVDNVKLEIYSNGWGELLETKYVKMGETVKIFVEEEDPYYTPPEYYIYAIKDDYYTGLYKCKKGDEITVNLKEVNTDDKLTGVLFGQSEYFNDTILDNCKVYVYQKGTYITEFTSDEYGIYSVNLEDGEYTFEFEYTEELSPTKVVVEGSTYKDIITPYMVQADKPNIYIYPEETVTLDVELDFPNGGYVTISDPEYGNGWNDIVVDPDGTIDGEYRFLFYESDNPDFSQQEYGWVIAYDDLEEFFRNNMEYYGFRGQEIEDFIEYWVEEEHLSEENDYYAIYPQLADEIEEEIVLNISQKPDSILRLIYTFVGLDDPDISIKEPEIEPFDREGFVVTEWGGILK